MRHYDVRCVLVIVPNHWGKGKDLKTAMREVRRTGYKPPKIKKLNGVKEIHYYFSCTPEQVEVTSFLYVQFKWPEGEICMRSEVYW